MEVSGSKPLVAVVSRRELTADDLRKLSGLRAEAGGGAHLLLPVDASRPERRGGYGCFLYGRGDTEVAAACRGWFHGGGQGHRACQAQPVGVPSGTVRSERHGGETMEEDAGLPWRYGVCVLAGLAVMVWVRRKETEGGR